VVVLERVPHALPPDAFQQPAPRGRCRSASHLAPGCPPVPALLLEMRHPNIILFMGVVLEPAAVVTGRRSAGVSWLVGAAAAPYIVLQRSAGPAPVAPPADLLVVLKADAS